ncbi:hypothetical protein J437_LFUL016843 [Ladona fulva]|uniref:Uncharacterized protein n=1 Tax=Ladona fulva TaxID=123851 RepID=A0A8K0KNT9_LADFU|nr:hypothetical protein J437_LFUL016843 [Ladona fulva]
MTKSPQANERLILVQQQMAKETHPFKLKMDVTMRWNSTYHMFQRICSIQEAVEATLGILHNPIECF